MKKKFVVTLMLIVFAINILFTGCASTNHDTDESGSSETKVTITDMGGDVVTLPANIKWSIII